MKTRLSCVALGVLLALPAMAKEGDTFRPFVSLGHHYDSNLFRLAETESPETPRDERYSVLVAGLNVDWTPGRQQLVLKATKTLVRYDRNTYLDFDGDDTQATWNWRLGNRLSGNVGTSKSTSQSSFEDIQRVNNQIDRESRYGRAEWEFHPRWRIGGGVEEVDNSNSDPSQISQNFKQQAHDVVLSYRTPKGSNLRLQARKVDAEFPNLQTLGVIAFPPAIEVADNSYKQTEYNLLGDWGWSGKVKVRGQVGWVDREYANVLRDDFNGFAVLKERPDYSNYAVRMTAEWYATGKTLLSLSAYQELGSGLDINTSSAVKRGGSLNGVWLMRDKWRLNAGASYENRVFEGDPGTAQRDDDTLTASLGMNYAPTRYVSVDVGVRAGRRDSSNSDENYKFHSVFANVRADF